MRAVYARFVVCLYFYIIYAKVPGNMTFLGRLPLNYVRLAYKFHSFSLCLYGMHVRFQPPAGFVEVRPSSNSIWWEDVAGNEHKELWLVRAPAEVSE